jgi:predicted nucleic acid-binding protein
LPVGLPWSTILAFLRLVTNPRIFERPEPVEQAWRQAEALLDSPVPWIPEPAERHREIIKTLLLSHGMRANLVPDAHLAALASSMASCFARAIPISPASRVSGGTTR